MIHKFTLGAAAVAVASFALLAAPAAEARGGGYGGGMRGSSSGMNQQYRRYNRRHHASHHERSHHHDRDHNRKYPGGAVTPVKGTPSDPNIGHRGAGTSGTKYPGGAVTPVKGTPSDPNIGHRGGGTATVGGSGSSSASGFHFVQGNGSVPGHWERNGASSGATTASAGGTAIVRDHRTESASAAPAGNQASSHGVVVSGNLVTNKPIVHNTVTLRDANGNRIPGRSLGKSAGQMLCNRTPGGSLQCTKIN